MVDIIIKFKSFFNSCNVKWAVCGGDAIDLFVGKETRKHKDLDIAVSIHDRERIINFMLKNNWQVYEPHMGKLHKITSIEKQLRTSGNIWCLSNDNQSYSITRLYDDYYDIRCLIDNQTKLDFVEFLFNKIEDNQFIYKRNNNITLPMEKAFFKDKNNIQYLCPEFVILYKSTFVKYIGSEDKDILKMIKYYRHDFDTAVMLMNQQQNKWLKHALKTCYPSGHEWISKL